MAYVIIAVVLIVIIVPIIAVLPSARQKAQMRMRKVAMAAGVSVDITTIDDPNPEQEKYISHNTGKALPTKLNVIAYRLQRRRDRDWRQRPKVSWVLERKQKAGDDMMGEFTVTDMTRQHISPEMIAFLNDSISALPADVEKVEEIAYNICIYWHEREEGSEEQVISFLKSASEVSLHIVNEDDETDELA